MVSTEVAIQDINNWLDAKKVSQKKRTAQADYIENLVSEVEEGNLSFDGETNKLSYSLKFPLKDEQGNDVLDKLEFKYRINSFDLNPYLKGIKPNDPDGRLMAYICALTGNGSGYIKKLDTEDLAISQAIAVFFV